MTSSYEEEMAAMEVALEWAGANVEAPSLGPIAICTDSQSLLMAIQTKAPETLPIRYALRDLRCKAHLLWVPGHAGLAGNELADGVAKEAAADTTAHPREISFPSIRAFIKRTIKDPPPTHPRIAMTYGPPIPDHRRHKFTRKEEVLLAQLRSGHCSLFKQYQKRIHPEQDPTCPLCEEGEHDLEHWLLRCPGNEAVRREILGGDAGLGAMSTNPEGVLALARRSLM